MRMLIGVYAFLYTVRGDSNSSISKRLKDQIRINITKYPIQKTETCATNKLEVVYLYNNFQRLSIKWKHDLPWSGDTKGY